MLNFLWFLLTIVILCDAEESTTVCPRIKYKREWGGKPSTNVDFRPLPVKYVVIHHTVTSDCSSYIQCSEILQNIQNYHMNVMDFDDIGYNFLIGNGGLVYEGTGWHVKGAHTYGYNANGLGIAFIGNYEGKMPTARAMRAAKKLIGCAVEKGVLDKHYELIGALQVSSTKSPGITLYNEIQNWPHWTYNPNQI